MCGGTWPEGSPDRAWSYRNKQGIEWDIDRNLPVYTRDLVAMSGDWNGHGDLPCSLREIIEDFASDGIGKPGGEPEVEPVAPDVKPVCFLGGQLLAASCADTTGCRNPVCARLGRERAGVEVAPDGESRPPTPSSRVATEYPDGNFPQLWSRNYLKRLIREEIQEAFAQRVREQNAAWVQTREGGN